MTQATDPPVPEAPRPAQQPTPAARGERLREQAGVIIGIATGVLGVLLTIGFVFLPASTLPEKMYVLFACLALSAASVTGIGAWRSARRFGLTAVSVCVAVVCLAMNNIIASQPASAVAGNVGPGSGGLVPVALGLWRGAGDRPMLRVWLVGCGFGKLTMTRATG